MLERVCKTGFCGRCVAKAHRACTLFLFATSVPPPHFAAAAQPASLGLLAASRFQTTMLKCRTPATMLKAGSTSGTRTTSRRSTRRVPVSPSLVFYFSHCALPHPRIAVRHEHGAHRVLLLQRGGAQLVVHPVRRALHARRRALLFLSIQVLTYVICRRQQPVRPRRHRVVGLRAPHRGHLRLCVAVVDAPRDGRFGGVRSYERFRLFRLPVHHLPGLVLGRLRLHGRHRPGVSDPVPPKRALAPTPSRRRT